MNTHLFDVTPLLVGRAIALLLLLLLHISIHRDKSAGDAWGTTMVVIIVAIAGYFLGPQP